MMFTFLDTPSGYAVPVISLPGAGPGAHGHLLLMPALGTPAGFYTPLGKALADYGFHVVIMEHRGIGESRLRASRKVDFGFAEVIDNDIPAVIQWQRAHAPTLPLYLMGHSLGGHYSAILAGQRGDEIDGVILAACGSPWIGAYRGLDQFRLRLLCRLIPVTNALCGYYPGEQIGFGGREARTLMNDWLALARSNRYQADGLERDIDTPIRDYAGPLLSLRMADDAFAPVSGTMAVTDKFASARVTRRVLDAETIGDRADHYRWARTPTAVVAAIKDWLS